MDLDMSVTLTPEKRDTDAQSRDDYADVPEMFLTLRAADGESADFAAQRDAIVNRCLPLADHIAYRYANRGQDLDDLIQVARLGLLKAVDRFDPRFGSSFTAFAVPTIMGEVRRHFRDRTWAMSVPRRMKELHTETAHAIPALAQVLGRAPTVTELARWLDTSREDVLDGLIADDARTVRSLDQPVGHHDGARTPADTVGAEDDRLQAVTDREALRPLLAELPEREKTILAMRFFESQTQSQIAERLGISQMHVSRLLHATLVKLRHQLQ